MCIAAAFPGGIETMREWAPFPLNGSSTVSGLYLLR